MSYFEKLVSTHEISYAGALPSPPQSSNPSPLLRKRTQRVQGSSESDEGTLVLGDREIWNEDYRAGGPDLPRLPAINEHLERDDSLPILWNEKLQEPVRHIINKWNIDAFFSGPIRRAHRTETVKRWRDTVLISATKGSVTDKNWFDACLPELNVEIIDQRAGETRLTIPIQSNDPFVTIWPSLRPKVLAEMGDGDGTLISVVRRGLSAAETEVTIAVTHVALEIFRGDLHQQEPSIGNVMPTRRDWETQAKIGGSLGPSGSITSAFTLGGYLNVEMADGSEKRFGVSNFHCPSLRDHISSLNELHQVRQALERCISPELATKIERTDPSVSEAERRGYQYQQQQLREVRQLIARAEEFSRGSNFFLGTVWAASGFRVTATQQRHTLDWALIDVVEGRLAENELPSIDNVRPRHQADHRSRHPVIQGIATLDEAMHPIEIGRRTGLTQGRLNGVKLADIQPWHQGQDGEWRKVRGMAYVILQDIVKPLEIEETLGRLSSADSENSLGYTLAEIDFGALVYSLQQAISSAISS
ncbi:hypothetical protein VTO42DRAFT_7923 [Malbranchea cinnamomea]